MCVLTLRIIESFNKFRSKTNELMKLIHRENEAERDERTDLASKELILRSCSHHSDNDTLNMQSAPLIMTLSTCSPHR